MELLKPVRTVAPAVTPVRLDDVKLHLRIDTDEEDTLIAGWIDAATALLDGRSGLLGLAIVTQTWRQDFPAFPSCYYASGYPGGYGLRLPLGPVQSVSSITYRDANNAQQTFSPANYVLQEDALGPFVIVAPGYTSGWPGTYSRNDAVSVSFVAGYGGISAVPALIKAAIKLLVGHWYQNREAVSFEANIAELPFAVKQIIETLRRVGI